MDKQEKDFLNDSLLYQMSLGSKELYHSNVWAWLINKDPNFVLAFFDPSVFETYKLSDYKITASRETKSRDIIIWMDRKDQKDHAYLIIENKIKSLPYHEQLEKYTEERFGKNKNKLIGAVVTGIEETLSKEERTIQKGEYAIEWTFRDYKKIAESILRIERESAALSKNGQRQQIEEYCDVVLSIYKLLKNALSENRSLTDRGGKDLEETGLSSVFMKLNPARFVKRVLKEKPILEEGLSKGFLFEASNSIQQGEACFDCGYTNWKKDVPTYFRMGIQIQGGQYRFFAARGVDKSDSSERVCAEIYKDMIEQNWFCRDRVHGKKEYCSYKGADYAFVYQYEKMNDELKDDETLIERIKTDLLRAKTTIDKYETRRDI